MQTEPDAREKRYRGLEVIGTGAMAEVYRCSLSGPRGFEKPVALKKLLPQWARDPVAVADFANEARLAALLQHENIVHSYDFGGGDGGYFLAMEYLAGKDLQAVMQRAESREGAIPAGLALHIAARICAGLEYAHTGEDLRQRPLNLIHRDLSPDNIFVTFEGQVKIIDFGIARADFIEDRSRMGMMKGKVGYMSPEQLAASPLDRRADIFAVGILLYEMLVGRRLYGGDTAAMIRNGRTGAHARLEEVTRGLPKAVCAVVEKALQPDRDLRYQSCGEMLADIEACYPGIQPQPNSQLLAGYICRLFAGELAAGQKRPPRPPQPPQPPSGPRPSPVEETEEGGGVATADRPPESAAPGAGSVVAEHSKPALAAWWLAVSVGLILIFSLASNIGEDEKNPEAGVQPTPVSLAVVAAPAPERPEKPPAQPPDRSKRIDEFLELAARAWKEQRLTEPEKDCALWFYSKILALDPKNAKAWQGIDRLGQYYGDRAEKALGEQRFQEAEQVVQKGLKAFPDNRRLVTLHNEMGARRQRYVQDLAEKAEQAMRRDDLITPEEDCAYTYYVKILKLDKHNEAALQGIDRIADRYADLAEDAYRNLKIANCREFVRLGLAVEPHHPRLLELQEDLASSMPGIFFKSLGKSLSTMLK